MASKTKAPADVQKSDLMAYACDLTLDPDTANNRLTLSEGNRKATYGAWQSYPDRLERFAANPQVFSRDSLKESSYWEVEWSTSPDESVYVGVAYGEIDRKSTSSDSQFGNNSISWCFGQYAAPGSPQPVLKAWHNGQVWEGPFPCGGCERVGVLLNYDAGTLSFYNVSFGDPTHLYTFQTKFTEPVYPCFWVGKCGNYLVVTEFI
uniref:stonustoxin subunit beta-like n=1 Tax=Scatophagus argus TaxID=75038 RepID=UPI001ED7F444|nr:stonustoxin subunit beta-like [Scatophagus argus]